MKLAPSFQGSNALREFILNRVFDALYYTRERLRNFIWREVVSQLNAHYSEIQKRHPDFSGKVSLASLSQQPLPQQKRREKRRKNRPPLTYATRNHLSVFRLRSVSLLILSVE